MFLRASLYLDNARLSSGNVQQIFSHSKCFILSFQVCKESWPWDHLISRVRYYKKGWYSWVTLHLSSLPQRWNIKTILFRQFFRDWDWRASMGCFTGISFTTLQPPPRHRAQFILNLFWGRWVSLERYLRTYKWCLNTTKAVYCWALQLIDHFNLDQGKFMSFNWHDDAMPAGIESWVRCPINVRSDRQNTFRGPTDGVFTKISSRLNVLVNFN